MVWKWDAVEPFGNNPANENPSGLGTFQMNLRHPGQYYDQEVGTFYNYHRDYDPGTGRYRQSDPIGLLGGMNTYTYVEADPLALVDVYGLSSGAKKSNGVWYWPPVKRNNRGWAVCDGNGGMRPQRPILSSEDEKCVGDCIDRHEEIHIQDFKKLSPSVCKGIGAGWRPAFPPKKNNDSERRAWDDTISCLQEKLKSLGECDACRPIVQKYLDDAPIQRKRYD